MWLTARELASELHIPQSAVTNLRNRGKVAYINLGSIKYPKYRYQMPKVTPAQAIPEIERIGLLTYPEVGEILGISFYGVQTMATRKQIKTVATAGNRRMISVAELRKVLAHRDKRRGQQKRSYSPILMKWLRSYLDSGSVSHEILDELIQKATAVTSARRSGYITKLWDLFDQANAVLKAIEQERRAPLGEEQRTQPAPQ